jgi:hypothetical protein
MDEDLGEFTRSDDELWYQVDVVVPVSSKLGGYGLFRTEFTVELGEVEMTGGAAVVDR